MRPGQTASFRKARPGEVFVYRTDFPVTQQRRMWGIFKTLPCGHDGIKVDFVGSDTGWSRFFETLKEVFLFAESLGLKPEVLPFDPDFSHLARKGELRPWDSGEFRDVKAEIRKVKELEDNP